jgi:UDP-N-acetylmuramyl pentapeptide phosphotransferase/UDP-N-acetylglucosamine-1-phosphate transferase
LAIGVVILLAAAAVSFALLLGLRPLLAHFALVEPNARSSHKAPTPQGGGIAVVAATLIASILAQLLAPFDSSGLFQLLLIFASAVGLAVAGFIDDLRLIGVIPRLIFQAAAVAVVIAVIPPEVRVFPTFPWWLDRALILLGGVWFINVVNFMDGIDWITIAEVVPITAALALFGLAGALPSNATMVAVALCGAMVGFAPVNRPVAKLFLGDVGSMPVGFLLVWLLVALAAHGNLAAALLLPLYYLADATITLLRRLVNGERITQPHRSHFYQRALDGGFSVYQIVGRVFTLNILLAALAFATIGERSPALGMICLFAGAVLVALVLWNFGRASSK